MTTYLEIPDKDIIQFADKHIDRLHINNYIKPYIYTSVVKKDIYTNIKTLIDKINKREIKSTKDMASCAIGSLSYFLYYDSDVSPNDKWYMTEIFTFLKKYGLFIKMVEYTSKYMKSYLYNGEIIYMTPKNANEQ